MHSNAVKRLRPVTVDERQSAWLQPWWRPCCPKQVPRCAMSLVCSDGHAMRRTSHHPPRTRLDAEAAGRQHWQDWCASVLCARVWPWCRGLCAAAVAGPGASSANLSSFSSARGFGMGGGGGGGAMGELGGMSFTSIKHAPVRRREREGGEVRDEGREEGEERRVRAVRE